LLASRLFEIIAMPYVHSTGLTRLATNGLLHSPAKGSRFQWFGQQTVNAQFLALLVADVVGIARNHDDGHIGTNFVDLPCKSVATHIRHIVIGDRCVKSVHMAKQEIQDLFLRRHKCSLVSIFSQNFAKGFAKVLFVVNEEYPSRFLSHRYYILLKMIRTGDNRAAKYITVFGLGNSRRFEAGR